jgi:hypothetical protein
MRSGYFVVSGVIFGFIASVQLLRAVAQVPVQIGSVEFPVWGSWIAVAVTGGLCAWAFAARR